MESNHQKAFDLLPHHNLFHCFYILTSKGHWNLEDHQWLTRVWNRNTKNPWFDALHDLYSLILYIDLRRSLIFGGQIPSVSSMVREGPQTESEHYKAYDLIPHMNFFHLFYILTSGGKWHWRSTNSRINRGQNEASEWNWTTNKSMSWYPRGLIFFDYIFWPHYWREVGYMFVSLYLRTTYVYLNENMSDYL